MLRADCPDCGTIYKLAPQAAGKRATCKKCGTKFAVPANAPKMAEPQLQKLPGRQLLSSVTKKENPKTVLKILDQSEDFPKPRVTIGHTFTALFVAGVMLVLPLLYVAFGVGVGWLTWWHATHNYVWMNIPSGRAKALMLVLYGGLIAAGVIMVLSLFKPLFFRFARTKEWSLLREDEPLLFEFAEELADKVGAPRPDKIRLSLDVNASASYDTRLFGLARKDFMLTLGIPLIAGLTMTQLAGIMAHEYGHFAQRGSTFLDRMVRRISLWFAVSMQGGDWIDDLIESFTGSENGLVGLIGLLMWIVVGLGRVVLYCLMLVGMAVSATLLRRMEYNADRYEIGLVGSKAFGDTCRRVVQLDLAYAIGGEFVFNNPRGDYLPNDFPSFVVGLANQSKRVKKKAEKIIETEQPGVLDTHPLMRNRIRAAERQDLPGVFKSSMPAYSLLTNFRELGERLSDNLYRMRYGPMYFPDNNRSVHEALDAYLNRMESRKAAD